MWWNRSSAAGDRAATLDASTPARHRRRPLALALEPRFMFDGAVAATHAQALTAHAEPVEAPTAGHGAWLDHLRDAGAPAATRSVPAAAASPATGPAVVFVDARVEDAASLLKGVAAGTEVVFLKIDQDGLQQMAGYLAQHHEVSAVEIVAHGNAGELLVGSTDLNASNIDAHAADLKALGGQLRQGGDILVYACDTAAGNAGLAFVDKLAALTGHAVAASSNVTGAGSDWTLEVRTGDISAAPVLSAQAMADYGYDLVSVATLAQLKSQISLDAADSTNDTITLTADIVFASSSDTIVINHTGSGTLTIDGGGHTIDANYLARVISVTAGKVVIVNATIEHGLLAGAGGNGDASAVNDLGAGISNAGTLTLANVVLTANVATGGGGGGGGTGLSFAFGGGGGGGASGKGGASSGDSYPAVYGVRAGSGSSGGTAYSVSGTYGGVGGTSSGGGNGGSSGGGFYAAGGKGATATGGGITIGGGGGGTGFDASAGNGGSAAGGIYNSGKLYVTGSTQITNNLGAGGGGGGGGGTGHVSGNGGQGVGALWNSAGGKVYMTSTAYSAMTGNAGASGHGGYAFNGGSAGSTPAAYARINSGSGTIVTNYVPTAPTVTSIALVGSSPNNASTEQFTVTFSTSVTGVDSSDFALTDTGSAAGSIASVAGSGSSYTVTVNGVSGDGTMRLDLKSSGTGIQDVAATAIAGGYTGGAAYTIDHTGPTVSSVAVPANATYIAGQNLDFTVNFNEAVFVTGTPQVALTLDTGGTVQAQYLSGSGTSALTFRYTVVANEADTNGVTLGSLGANGGTLRDAATNAATLALNGVASTAGVLVDAVAPSVSSVGAPSNGTYGSGQNLDFTVNFSEAVTVDASGGTPYISLTLDTGGTVHAAYVSGSGSGALTFRYVVASGNSDSTGVALGAALTLNGATIRDAATNAAALTLNSVAATTGVLVDAVPPTVSAIARAGGSSLNNAVTETFTVTFSEDVSLNPPDTTDFTLVASGSAGGTVSSVAAVGGSVYTVTVSGVTGDGTLRLDLNTGGSTITDAFGNALVAAHTGDQSYTVDHTAPGAVSMTVPANGSYGAGQNLDFAVTFGEVVTVDTSGGTPRLAVTLDTGGTVYASYVSGSGTTTLTFRLTVQAGQQDLTGIVTATSLDANGGTLRDAATNNALLSIAGVEPSTAGVAVDAALPVVASVAVPASGSYGIGQALDFSVAFNKAVTVDTSGGTPAIALTLDTGGTVQAAYVSGSGSGTLVFRYVVASGNLDTDGVALGSAIVLNGASVHDAMGNPIALALNAVATSTGVRVDGVAPTLASISDAASTPTAATSTSFTVNFSEAVSGVDASDFTLHTGGTVSGTIAAVSGSGASYTVRVDNVGGDGTLRLDLAATGTAIVDGAGNAIAGGYTAGPVYTFDHTAPVVTAVGVPAAGTYRAGANLDLQVHYGEAVLVDTSNGSPAIAITLDTGGTVQAVYLAGSGSSTLTFRYVVGAGTLDGSGITLGSVVASRGAVLADAVGNAADANLAGVPGTASVKVDGTDPAVASIATNGATSVSGSSVVYTVHFNEAVSGAGAADFVLGSTGTATGTVSAVSVVDASTVAVTVTGVSGDGTLRLDVAAGSAIVDAAGTPVAAYALGPAYTVDHTAPRVADVAVPAAGTYVDGQGMDFSVAFDSPVTLDTSGGTPMLTLQLDGGRSVVATLVASASTSTQLSFRYTVATGDVAAAGVTLGALDLHGATLVDAAGNAADLTLHGVGSTAQVDVDAVAPVVTAVTVPAAGLYVAGQNLDFDVGFSRAVTVDTSGGTPAIAITLDTGGTVLARYVSGSGGSSLVFRYTVASGNADPNGIAVAAVISANGGSISGLNNAGAVLALQGLGSTAGVDVGEEAHNPIAGARPVPVAPPYIWVVDGGVKNAPAAMSDPLPITAQATWAPAPLLSAGLIAGAEPGSPGGAGGVVGSAGFTTLSASTIDTIVNPLAIDFPALVDQSTDRLDPLVVAPPSDVVPALPQPALVPQRGAAAPRQFDAGETPQRGVAGRADARALAHAHANALVHAGEALAPALAATPLAATPHPAGKASLAQQFARHGHQAWASERAVLADTAHRLSQSRETTTS